MTGAACRIQARNGPAEMPGGWLRNIWRTWRRKAGAGAALGLYREGIALGEQSRFDEAAAVYRQALALDPSLAEAHNNLGRVLEIRGDSAGAAECYRRSIGLKPRLPHPCINLGNLLQRRNDLDAALGQYQEALARDPAIWEAQNNLANILLERGEHEAALRAFARAVQLRPDDPIPASNALNCGIYALADSPERLLQEYRAWGRRFAEPLRAEIPQHANQPDPQRRLRIGYVSPDFRKHAMGYFIEPILEHHDAAKFEVTCYNNWPRPDPMTARFRKLSHRWRDIAFVADADLAQTVAADGIDLLVDLAGHTSDNRLLLFARKPSPVQFTFLGYPNTTGVAAIDYRITDALADPPGMTDAYYTERLLRLPASLWCYRAPDSAPDVGPLPGRATGWVTFGSFNGFHKITAAVIDVWARLLTRVAGSRLVMITVAEGEAQRRLREAFGARGIGTGRLELYPRLSVDGYFAMRNRVDIALDPFPVNGGTTTCDSLWMGVPTVTLAGRVFVSRAGVSLLTNVGLPELIARNLDEYVEIAAGLAANPATLESMRSGLRTRMRGSPLCDAPRFVAGLERLYRDAWAGWCAARRAAPLETAGAPAG
jgi:predicted O-linked N-acetylglucosamine transferase (SPINDLY family)